MDISIIIPSKDRNKILLETLEKAYIAIEQIDAEIILINDSKTEQIDVKPEWTDKLKVFDNPKSGVASARNLGASKANANLMLFMDDDMWLSDANINAILELKKSYPLNSCFNLNWIYPPELSKNIKGTQFGRYLTHYGFDSLEGWCRNSFWNATKIFQSEGITSQNLVITKADFYKAGGYNEKFPHAGAEDYDFGKRLKAASIQAYVYPLSMMYHNEADRMNVKAWLARKRRGGETRRVAVEVGYSELNYPYGPMKSIIYKSLQRVEDKLLKLLESIPNVSYLDPVYFRILNTLLGTAFYTGYNSKKK